jgi:hypothetical protein
LDALATLHFGAPIDTNTVLTAKRRERAYQVADPLWLHEHFHTGAGRL